MKHIKLKYDDIGALCGGLGYLIRAGIGGADALALMAQDETNPVHREMLQGMKNMADGGAPLSATFAAAECFPSYVCSLLAVGERVGRLEESLKALASYYDARARMSRRLKGELLYPALLLAVLLVVMVVLLVWVLPVFNEVYAQMGSSLTGLAGSLLGVGIVLRQSMPVLLAVLAAVIVLAIILWKNERIRKNCADFWWRHLGGGGLSASVLTARFAQALAMGMSSGLTQEEAVELAASLAEGTPAFRDKCGLCLSLLEQGKSLPQALKETELIPHAQCRLLEAGLRGGCAEQVMEQTAQRLMEDSEAAVERRVAWIEPVLVIFCCVLVGMVLLSVMLPLMHIMTAIG